MHAERPRQDAFSWSQKSRHYLETLPILLSAEYIHAFLVVLSVTAQTPSLFQKTAAISKGNSCSPWYLRVLMLQNALSALLQVNVVNQKLAIRSDDHDLRM